MLTAAEKKHLKNLLAMADDPDTALSYDELLGFLFGLAMTPDLIAPSEWMEVIFGGDLPAFDSVEKMQKMTGHLIQVYNKCIDLFDNNKLTFPFNIEKLKDSQLAPLYEWVSGFEEAIFLRDELWDPEEYPDLSDRRKEELYQSMMTIQGLVDPVEAMDYFEDMPDEVFQEVFSGLDSNFTDREAQVQIFLMASLPLAVETLQDHARTVLKKRQQQLARPQIPTPIRSAKIGRNEPCPCNSGKKYKKCCGSSDDKQAVAAGRGAIKKSNVIHVDFPRHGKKRSSPVPVYQLKVALQGAKPPIWRRIQVPGDTTLAQLHQIVQICMDWEDVHLHQFVIDRTCYTIPDSDDFWQTRRPKNEAKFTLHDLEKKIQPHFEYTYDFGDNWVHRITLEKTLPPGEGNPCPVLVTGRRAAPPEDIGGIHHYMHILKVLSDPEDEEYEEMTNWLNFDFFDPAQFDKEDIAGINTTLNKLWRKGK